MLQFQPLRFGSNTIIVYLARGKKDRYIRLFVEIFHHPQDLLIDPGCASAAAKCEYHKILFRNPQFFPVSLPIRVPKLLPDRIPGNHHPAPGGKKRGSLLESHEDPVSLLLQDPVGQPRIGVLLVDIISDTPLLGSFHHRSAYITAGADYQVRPEFPEYPPGLQSADRQFLQGSQVFQHIFSVEAPDPYKTNRIAMGRNNSGFHSPFGADEQDLRLRMMFPDGISDGDGRIDVAAGSATGHDDSHFFSSPLLPERAGCFLDTRDIFRRMPIDAIKSSRALPP